MDNENQQQPQLMPLREHEDVSPEMKIQLEKLEKSGKKWYIVLGGSGACTAVAAYLGDKVYPLLILDTNKNNEPCQHLTTSDTSQENSQPPLSLTEVEEYLNRSTSAPITISPELIIPTTSYEAAPLKKRARRSNRTPRRKKGPWNQ